jgi:hypothetical protein
LTAIVGTPRRGANVIGVEAGWIGEISVVLILVTGRDGNTAVEFVEIVVDPGLATAGASETTLVIPCPSLSQANP